MKANTRLERKKNEIEEEESKDPPYSWAKYQLLDRIRKIIVVGKPKNIDKKTMQVWLTGQQVETE